MDLLNAIPKTQYNGVTLTNLLANISVITENFSKFQVYYPYRVQPGERPDTIAYDYYGNSDYAWLVMLSNQIIDPYLQWPLDDSAFHNYLRAKYGYVWETKSEIDHYIYTGIGSNDPLVGYLTHKLTPATFAALSVEDSSGWTPVYVYDYEYDLNESKRSIKLLSNQYLKQVDREISAIFS